jgi:hypothetical protein
MHQTEREFTERYGNRAFLRGPKLATLFPSSKLSRKTAHFCAVFPARSIAKLTNPLALQAD